MPRSNNGKNIREIRIGREVTRNKITFADDAMKWGKWNEKVQRQIEAWKQQWKIMNKT